jgi:hypothetical protein
VPKQDGPSFAHDNQKNAVMNHEPINAADENNPLSTAPATDPSGEQQEARKPGEDAANGQEQTEKTSGAGESAKEADEFVRGEHLEQDKRGEDASDIQEERR